MIDWAYKLAGLAWPRPCVKFLVDPSSFDVENHRIADIFFISIDQRRGELPPLLNLKQDSSQWKMLETRNPRWNGIWEWLPLLREERPDLEATEEEVEVSCPSQLSEMFLSIVIRRNISKTPGGYCLLRMKRVGQTVEDAFVDRTQRFFPVDGNEYVQKIKDKGPNGLKSLVMKASSHAGWGADLIGESSYEIRVFKPRWGEMTPGSAG